jgi:hypothetical protein
VTRWVIVAQLTENAHVPDVFGTWETAEAAQEVLDRLYERIDRSFGRTSGTAIALSVEPVFGKRIGDFDKVFEHRTGFRLSEDNSGPKPRT